MSVHTAVLAPTRAPRPHLVALSIEHDPVEALTPREREVLCLMAAGQVNGTICQHLFISPKTLERHVQNIFIKLDLPPDITLHRRVSAVLTWLRSPLSRGSLEQVLPTAEPDRAGCTLGARANGEEQRLWMHNA